MYLFLEWHKTALKGGGPQYRRPSTVRLPTNMATGLTSSGMAAGPAWGESSLPRLAQETELQKMLADEKMRSEQHRTNYQTLKVEHTRYVLNNVDELISECIVCHDYLIEWV